ncbi:thioredoxin, partial [Streptomyces sp. NPDC127574]
MTGLVVCLAVLALASVYGVLHRRRSGRVTVRGRDDGKLLGAAD